MYSWSWEAKESHSLTQSSPATVCIKKELAQSRWENLSTGLWQRICLALRHLASDILVWANLRRNWREQIIATRCPSGPVPAWMPCRLRKTTMSWHECQKINGSNSQLTAPPRHPMTKTIAFPATPTRSINIPKPTTSTQPLWSLETVKREHARIIMTFLECLDTGQLKCPHFGSSGLQWAHWSECGTLWPERAHVYSHVAHVCSCLLLLILIRLIDISSTGNRQCHA